MSYFCVFDLETTGPDPDACAIVQMATISFRIENGQVEDLQENCWLINPGCEIPKEASDVHGITNETIKGSPWFDDLADEIHQAIEARTLIGYNGAHFDLPILKRHFGESFILPDTIIDPLVEIRKVDKYVKGKGRHKLTVTCERHGIELDKAHDALGDCRMTLGLALELGLVERFQSDPQFIAKQNTLAKQQEYEFQQYKNRTKKVQVQSKPAQVNMVKTSCDKHQDKPAFGCKDCISAMNSGERAAKEKHKKEMEEKRKAEKNKVKRW